jgi:nucleotide-binding universal stress UspA family protein
MKVRKLKRILVPVSLAGDGENAFRQALFFRRRLSSQITLLHVVAPGSILGNAVQSDTNKNLQARAMIRLIRFVKIHFKGKIPENMKLRVEIGYHISTIIEIARTEKFDLLIINKTKKKNGLIDKFKKHSADHIVGESICPVLSVENRWTNRGVRDILVPIDISRKSRDLLEWSIFMGHLLNARIHLLASLLVKIELERSLAFKKAHIMEELIMKEGVKCKVTIVEREEGTRLDALLFGAKKQSADLIMVQGHQEMIFSDGQGERLVTEFLHSSSVPVLCLGIEMNSFFTDLLGAGNSRPHQYEVSN